LKKALLAILLVFALGQEASANSFRQDGSAHELVARISGETLNTEYEKAILHTHDLIDLYPREPFPRFILTSIYMYMLRSYWDYPADRNYAIYKKKFKDAAAEAIKVCDEYPVQDAMVHYVRGMVLGAEGMVHLQDSEWLDSYSLGKTAVASLEKSLELDPQNYDAYLGLGMFEYYCSKLTGMVKILAWIVGFSGNSEKGLEYVTKAVNYGTYAEGPAKVFLAFALIEFENKLDQGVEISRSLRKQYPRNYVFIEYLVRAARKLPDERASEGIGWIESYVKTPNWRKDVILFAPYNLDMVDYVHASLYMRQGNYAAARELLEPLASRPASPSAFSTEVNLALLLIYKKTENHAKAEQLYSVIMNNKSINDSHAKAKELLKG
jgi:tetratricopeptide (TPR) repeat protein